MYVQILHKGHISHEALREINGKLKLHQCKFLKKINEKPRRLLLTIDHDDQRPWLAAAICGILVCGANIWQMTVI
jgi:hypothetical protein